MTTLNNLKQTLRNTADSERAKNLAWFFKTDPGEYGEGDKFLGIKVPELRKIAKSYAKLPLSSIKSLIQSPFHEERMTALLILMGQYKKAKDENTKKTIFDFYIKQMRYINNWDLVDVSAPHIIGHYLFNKDTAILYRWIKSNNLWTRRIAILTTFHFIRQNSFDDTLNLIEASLQDKEDLIHKACGWMLREVGKRDFKTAENFLNIHSKIMPRTMLRYAIERFPENKRQKYLRVRRQRAEDKRLRAETRK